MATLVAKSAGLVELTVGVLMSSPPIPPPPVPSLPPHPAMSIASGIAINHIILLLNNFSMWVGSFALHTEYCQCKLGRKTAEFPLQTQVSLLTCFAVIVLSPDVK